MVQDVDEYVEEFKDMIECNEADYRVFKEFYEVIADCFDSARTSELRLEQLDGILLGKEGDLSKLSDKDARVHMVQKTADIYDDLGIIGSNLKSYPAEDEPVKIYRIPEYNGRGYSKSWEGIKQTLGEAMTEAEKKQMRIQKKKEELERLEERFRRSDKQ